MTDQEYQALKAKFEKGQALTILDRFIFDLEQRVRHDGPDTLEKQAKAAQNQESDPVNRFIQHKVIA